MQDECQRDEVVMTLLEGALNLPEEARSSFLDTTCADPEIRAEVEQRIQWEQRMGAFLCDPVIFNVGPLDRGFEPGELLAGRFRIVREVGRGGMGIVYEAFDDKLERRVALKSARAGFGQRLPPEARAAREVSSFNVCKVHELHSAETELGEFEFLSMEFIDGETLGDRIARSGPLPPGEALEIARQVCAGLAQAHRQGVIHSDLKSSNIILAQSSEGRTRAVITDFGLALFKPTGDELFFMSQHGGTYDYMAPELFGGGRASVASDLYALGVLFHEMLTGKRPAWVSASPPLPAEASTMSMRYPGFGPHQERICLELPAPWRAIVHRCLQLSPADRFGSVDEVMERLVLPRATLKWAFAAPIAAAILAAAIWLSRGNPAPLVRLAVLPIAVEGSPLKTAVGLAVELADRLSGLRRGFVAIPPLEAQRNQVLTPEKARTVLSATHVLSTRIRNSNGQVTLRASLVDTASGSSLQAIDGNYSAADTPVMAKALAAMVTSAFHLRSSAPKESVAPAAYPFYVQGIGLLRRDPLSAAEAIPFFDQAIQSDPRSALPYAGLAEAQLQQFQRGFGREWLQRAEQTVAKAQSLNADVVPVLLVAGLLKEQHGWYERAAQDYTRAVELAPDNGEAWKRLAGAYSNMNRPEEAIATYRKAIQTQPDYYSPYLDLGLFYYLRGQFPEAEKYFRRTTEIVPGLSSGHMDLGLALKDQGRLQEAEQSLLTALRLQENPRTLVNLGSLYYQEERFAEALPLFEKSAGSGPSAISYGDVGDAYRHLSRPQDAAKAYHTAQGLAESQVARNPRDPFVRAVLARLSALLGERRRAEFEIAQALSLNSGLTRVIRTAASTFEILGERDKTLQVLGNAPWRLLDDLNRQPDMKDLQRDPQFQELIRSKSAQQ
jgi:tetratricopeptide (TPR) repeat protein